MKMDLNQLMKKAQKSSFYRGILNWGLGRTIPFNKPHGLTVKSLTDDGVVVKWPYKRKNLNHIKGLHACGLATLSEFSIGFSLLRKLDIRKYRIILKSIHVDYFYQGKTAAIGKFEVSDEYVEREIFKPLQLSDTIDVTCEIDIFDELNNKLATGITVWQVKSWEKVKTKL